MDPRAEFTNHLARRTFLGQTARGVGGLALGTMLMPELLGAEGAGCLGVGAGLGHEYGIAVIAQLADGVSDVTQGAVIALLLG